MVIARHRKLSALLADLQAEGRIVFARAEAEEALGTNRRSFLKMAERLQSKGHLLSPRRGFYVIVPPQFFAWGAPPPAWFVDDLMNHEKHPYYVGLLKAAELHGASHQAVMEFQVISDHRMPKIQAGRSLIAFYYRRELDSVASGIEDRKTETGKMRLSSPELTALDLLRYPRASGGLDNVATILAELGEKLDPAKLAILSAAFELSVRQRLGYLLARSGLAAKAEVLVPPMRSRQPVPWIELDPLAVRRSEPLPAVVESNPRWRVHVRHLPEPDA